MRGVRRPARADWDPPAGTARIRLKKRPPTTPTTTGQLRRLRAALEASDAL